MLTLEAVELSTFCRLGITVGIELEVCYLPNSRLRENWNQLLSHKLVAERAQRFVVELDCNAIVRRLLPNVIFQAGSQSQAANECQNNGSRKHSQLIN